MKSLTVASLVTACLFASPVLAQDNLPMVLKARQGQFNIMALNLGVLGGMAQGNMDYDAAAAQAAADTLVAVSMIQQGPHWPAASDNMAAEGTRALPAIWDNNADFLAKWASFGAAATEAAGVVGTGKDALGPVLGKIGGTCKACHDTYRAPAG